MDDPYDLERFVTAQAPVYPDVLGELRAGLKTSHWMWFVFPQLAALGRSSTAKFYGLASRDEALAYWRHPVLGPRLAECSTLLLGVQGRTAQQIFGATDALKLRSCMTLFMAVAPEEPAFAHVVERYYDGAGDPQTLMLISPR